jgi:hypothetical protein
LGSGFDSSTEFQAIFKLSDEKILFAPFLVKNENSLHNGWFFLGSLEAFGALRRVIFFLKAAREQASERLSRFLIGLGCRGVRVY